MNETPDAPEADEPARRFVVPVVTVAEGKVDRAEEHIAFWAGRTDEDEDNCVEVALLAPADVENTEAGSFVLEWVLSEAHPEAAMWKREVLEAVDFFLVEKQEERPWGYALYHCGTTSNACAYMNGRVHFCHMPKADE